VSHCVTRLRPTAFGCVTTARVPPLYTSLDVEMKEIFGFQGRERAKIFREEDPGEEKELFITTEPCVHVCVCRKEQEMGSREVLG